MTTIGRLVAVGLVLVGLAGCVELGVGQGTGRVLQTYTTDEGVGVLGPDGGWFTCYNELDCAGTPG